MKPLERIVSALRNYSSEPYVLNETHKEEKLEKKKHARCYAHTDLHYKYLRCRFCNTHTIISLPNKLNTACVKLGTIVLTVKINNN